MFLNGFTPPPPNVLSMRATCCTVAAYTAAISGSTVWAGPVEGDAVEVGLVEVGLVEVDGPLDGPLDAGAATLASVSELEAPEQLAPPATATTSVNRPMMRLML